AKPGSSLNLSTKEIAAFRALPAGDQEAVQRQLQKMLLDRYQAYRTSGLAGIKAYARGGGLDRDLASDLRKATDAAQNLAQFLPRFHEVLLTYPKGMDADMRENFFWMRSIIQGKPTDILQQTLVAADGDARAVVQRQFYASRGYNGEQAVAGFLPVSGGTIVVYSSHAFTDQVTGLGGFAKRGIGSRMMADSLRKMFEASRTRAVQYGAEPGGHVPLSRRERDAAHGLSHAWPHRPERGGVALRAGRRDGRGPRPIHLQSGPDSR